MKKKALLFFCQVLFLTGFAQPTAPNAGIVFEQDLNWPQVLAKAKQENKYIFIDCYTTWCIPCKRLAKEIFPQPLVGDFFNQQFISVQVQMDSSAGDNQRIKDWYIEAKMINQQYGIRAYPTMLILDADGLLLDQVVGFMEAPELIAKARSIISPENNYYALLDAYKKGERNLKAMGFLARKAKFLKDTAVSDAVAADYLRRLQKSDLLSKGNIEFTREFTKTTADPGFVFFQKNARAINRVMEHTGYAEGFVSDLIYKELLSPALLKAKDAAKQPAWPMLRSGITKKYGATYADRCILNAMGSWALSQKDYPTYTKTLVERVEKQYILPKPGDPLESLMWNNLAWQIFLHSNDVTELEKALAWTGNAVLLVPDPNWIDSRANLIYKLGRKDEAIKWETLALAQIIYLTKDDPAQTKSYQATLEKMKNGQPTWPVK